MLCNEELELKLFLGHFKFIMKLGVIVIFSFNLMS